MNRLAFLKNILIKKYSNITGKRIIEELFDKKIISERNILICQIKSEWNNMDKDILVKEKQFILAEKYSISEELVYKYANSKEFEEIHY
jgi:hypothetical protein